MPNPSAIRRHKGLVRHSLHQTLHIDVMRFAVALARYQWFVRVRRGLRTLDAVGPISPNTVTHNVKGMRDLAVARSLTLIRPLSVIEGLDPDADVLVIGPRTEGELLALLAHGFDRSSIRAIDLISYSPWVDLGDMHALPYRDRSFDAVVAGWVLAYSDDKKRAASEILRVSRPGAVIAVGVEWSPRSDDEFEREVGYVPGSRERLRSTDEILALFGDSVDRVFVRHDPVGEERADTFGLVAIFSVRGSA